jgi:hypothetical protein
MDVDSEWPIGAHVRTKIERQCETSPVRPHIVGDYEYTQELENDETVWHGWLHMSRAYSGEMGHGLHSEQRRQQCKMRQQQQEQQHQHQQHHNHHQQQQHFQRAANWVPQNWVPQQEQQPSIECDAAQVWAPPTAPWHHTIVPLQLRSGQACVDTTDPLGDLPTKRQRTI